MCAGCWRPCCGIPWWPSTTPTTRRPERRCSIPTRCLCAATISSGIRPADHLAAHRGLRLGLAIQRRRPPGGLAVGPALRAGLSRAELPGADADPGAHLGRPGSADHRQRHGAALVECDALADALGGARINAMAAKLLAQAALDAEKRAPALEALAPLAAPGRARAVEQLLAQGEVQRAIELVTPSELFCWPATSLPGRPPTIRPCWRKSAGLPRPCPKRSAAPPFRARSAPRSPPWPIPTGRSCSTCVRSPR